MMEGVRQLKAAGLDGVNVPDGPRAQMRMGVIPTAVLLYQNIGIEPVMHYCCRDRNCWACCPICSERTRWAYATC